MPDLITQTKFADLMGVNRKEVTKWKQANRLIMKGKLVDFEATKLLLEDTADPAHSTYKQSSKPRITFADMRTANMAVKNARDKLKLDIEKGKVVNAQEILSELVKSNIAVKNRLRSISSFIQLDISQIYKNTDIKKQREVSAVILKHIDEVLKEISEWKPAKS